MTIQYKMVQQKDFEKFIEGVNKKLEEGWELYGEPHYPKCFNGRGKEKFCYVDMGFWGQALIKK
jgi:hypothetical protein